MSIIDSPIGRCEAVHEMVLLDETQQECACEHGCPPGFDCPLAGYFAKVSGLLTRPLNMFTEQHTQRPGA